jgi:hypothetical protein
MIAALRTAQRLVALLLQLTALAGGPGLNALEVYEHTHRSSPGHGHRAHYEQRGGQDHDDVCRIYRSSAPVRTPDVPSTIVVLPDSVPVSLHTPYTKHAARFSHRLPPSRAPPTLIL